MGYLKRKGMGLTFWRNRKGFMKEPLPESRAEGWLKICKADKMGLGIIFSAEKSKNKIMKPEQDHRLFRLC